jgi:hypothetical protein
MILPLLTVSIDGLLNILLSNKSLAPAFHLILDTVQGGEGYNLIIRGGVLMFGALTCTSMISKVTNKDECITVKVSINYSILVSQLLLFC